MPTLKFGLIGLGYFGKNYLRLLKEIPGVKLKAISDSSPDILRGFSHMVPVAVEKSVNPDDVFKNKEIDCVVIATPTLTHFSLARSALERGKNVLIEKPMTASLKEAEELKAVVDKSGKTFMVGHQYVYNDHLAYLKSQLEKQILGEIKYVFAEHFYTGHIQEDVGCFWETAPHEFSIVEYLFSPGEVSDICGSSVDISGNKKDDYTSVFMKFANGLSLAVSVSWFSPEKVRKIIFAGTGGMAVFNDSEPRDKLKFVMRPYPGKEEIKSSAADEEKIFIPKINAKEPLRNELEHFIHCVSNKKTPLTDINHGLRIIELLDAVKGE